MAVVLIGALCAGQGAMNLLALREEAPPHARQKSFAGKGGLRYRFSFEVTTDGMSPGTACSGLGCRYAT